MSKRGSPALRYSLWLTDVSTRRFNLELETFCEPKRNRGKHHSVASGATARLSAQMIYSV